MPNRILPALAGALLLALALAAPAEAQLGNTKSRTIDDGPGRVFERADAAHSGGDTDAAFALLAEGVERWPAQVASRLSYDFLAANLARTPVEAPGRHRLLQALDAAGYQRPHEADSSELWYQLALGHLHRGDAEAARRALERVAHPQVWLAVRIDKRFDAAVSPDDPRNDAGRAVTRRVAELRSRAFVAPKVGDLLREQLEAMMMAGMHEDVVRIVGEVQARAAEGKPVFDDQDESLAWIYDTGARALLRLGRDEEALAIYRQAAAARESGAENVSQRINLASVLASLGRADEAAAVAATVPDDRISGYGRMVLASVNSEIARLRGDQAALRETGEYLREHRDVAESVHFEWLLGSGRQDEAAADFIARLEDPENRRLALLEAQRLRRARETPGAARHTALFEALLARPDVQAAIGRVGRVLDVPAYAPW